MRLKKKQTVSKKTAGAENSLLLQSKYSAHSAHYLGMILINRNGLHYWNQNSIFELKIEMFQR